ncbi:MAG TPA: hypothetical protein VHV57_15800 [Acidimicrobiales bacterium]|jgi:hypothetical protein|nr:hypothetical protein [Acidimicrobiales bacterium]
MGIHPAGNVELHARRSSRGLGTAWTGLHLEYEREVADILGLPYDDVMQVALIPVAHTIGFEFKPGSRSDWQRQIHWNAW